MSIHQAFSLLKKSPLSRQVLVLSHVYLASFYSLLISFLRGSVSCLHAGKKGPARAKKGRRRSQDVQSFVVRKQFKCFARDGGQGDHGKTLRLHSGSVSH